MFSLFKRKNYTVCEKAKAAILVEIPVGCWMDLLGTAEHGPPFPKRINICFSKAIKVTLDLKYPKDITGTSPPHLMILGGGGGGDAGII